jgi:hypothetical protein
VQWRIEVRRVGRHFWCSRILRSLGWREAKQMSFTYVIDDAIALNDDNRWERLMLVPVW